MKILKYILYILAFIGISIFGYMKITNKNINELGLSIFSMFKKVTGSSVNMNDVSTSNSKLVDHNEWSYLLAKHVSIDGKVDYKGFSKNKSQLEIYLNNLSKNPPQPSISKEEKLAYWINAYNAFTVKLIIDHYPLKSIKDISDGLPMIDSPWDLKFFKIGGIDFDLNTIEHEVLRKQFDEPRIHFAINCASFSCPKLRHEAYLPKYLEHQLNDQTSSFINNVGKNQISVEGAKLSLIFNWFQGDFTKNGSLISFIQKYNPNMKEGIDLSYLDYDWNLNGK